MERIQALELIAKISDSSFKSYDDFISKQGQLEKQIIELRSENSKLNKQFKETGKDSANLTQDEIDQRRILARQIATNKDELRKLTTEQRGLNKEIKSIEQGNAGYKRLSDRLAQVKREIKELGVQGKQAPKELQEEFEILDATLRKTEERVGDYQRSIGNYASAFDGFTENISLGFDTLIGKLGESQGALGATASATGVLRSGFNALLANPIVAFFAAISAALSLVFNLFSRTEKGASLLAKGTALLNGVFSSLVGLVDSAVDTISRFADDPVKGIEELGQALVENVLNRFRAIIELAKSVGSAVQSAFELDFDGIKDAASEAQTALIQLGTGLDADQQKEFADAVKETTSNIVENAKAFAALEERRRAIRRQNRELSIEFERINTVLQTQQSIADDTTRSFAEREQAAERARQAIERAAAKEIELAKNQLELISAEIALRRANGEEVEDLADQQTNALTAVIQAERNLTLAIAENEKTRAELKQDRLERDLDILIDGFDNQKTINERLIADDRKTLDARQQIFEETSRLAEESFNKQIETIQQFTGVAVNANELILESDSVALNNRIRALGLSEIIEGRLLEVIRERRTALQDLTETQELLNQALAQQQITDIQTTRNEDLSELFNDTTKTYQEIAEEQLRIQFAADKAILEQQLASSDIAADERAKLERELAELQLEERQRITDQIIDNTIKGIELERIERTKAVLESEKNQEEASRRIAQIDIETAIEVAEVKLRLQELNAEERAQIELELIENRKQAAINAEQEISEKRKETQEQLESGASQTFGLIAQLEQARVSRESAALERTYQRRLSLAEGNAEETAALEEELAQRREQLERQAFERQKAFALAQAAINGALAVTKILAETPKGDFGIATGIQIGLAAATTAAQIAAIQAQTFHTGGMVDDDNKPGQSSPVPLKKNEVLAKLEKKEMVVTAGASRDNKVYHLEGTKKQIVSAINKHSGGVDFAPGAQMSDRISFDTSSIPQPSAPVFGRSDNLSPSERTIIVNRAIGKQDIKDAIIEATSGMTFEIDVKRLASEMTKSIKLKNNARG